MSEAPLHERLREVADAWVPPEGLRERALDAAAPLVRDSVGWSDRVWFSPRWRLAALGVLGAVFALDFAVATGPSSRAGSHENARETARAVDEAARQAGLGADEAHLFARRAFALASRPDPEAMRASFGAPAR